jgi:hypothetical protein
MKIQTTRLPTAVLRPVVHAAVRDIERIDHDFGGVVHTLSDAERRVVPRTREGFPPAARVLANLIRTRPEIVAVTEFDSEAVIEDLDNVELVDLLIPRLEGLLQRLQDARLRWLAEAQEPTLATYSVAKTRAERDGTLAAMIEPLRVVLANPRNRNG